ncbi:MAG: tetratricopeptide repeat protein [Paenibacillus lautus]|uniref:tetratricopeptide repeat protein n=1 Tax=Paenibacillus lautus TaxID=1401 RepID=UPI0026ED5E92|nr:tetratricopeptide repeat protein [Paenibacillus lautus]MCI1775761.1 tetratricopeptide repeat protein [Paenibacillus lautus]
MFKLIIFGFLFYIFGNPITAILVLLLIVYVLDRRFVGVFPSVTRPFKRARAISKLRRQIAVSPSDVSSRHELARLLLERRKYEEALKLLETMESSLEDSAEFWDDIGSARLHTGSIAQGETDIVRALQINPRVKYGRPYLRLAEAFRDSDREKALHYLEQFHAIHSSSSEAFYLLGYMYQSLGRAQDAKKSYQESMDVYRSLPKYKKRQERKWAVRSWFRNLF